MTNLWPAFRCPQHQKTGQNTQQVMFLRQFSTCLVNLLHVRAWHFWCGTNCIIYSCHVSSQCLGHCFPTILNLGRSTYSRWDSSDRKVSLVQIPVREGFSLIEKNNCSQWIPDRIWTTMLNHTFFKCPPFSGIASYVGTTRTVQAYTWHGPAM